MSQLVTKRDGIERHILPALGKAADQYDVEAIADEVLGDYHQQYRVIVDTDTFWDAVQRHAKNTSEI